MNYHYHEHRSRIVDQLLFPNLAKDWLSAYKDMLKMEQLAILKEDFDFLKIFEELLEPYTKCIQKFHINIAPIGNFMLHYYMMLLDTGFDPSSTDDLFDYALKASESEIRLILWKLVDLKAKGSLPSDGDFLTILEESLDSNDLRWQVYWAYRHPLDFVQGLVTLYQEILPLYHPYHEMSAKSRHDFGKTLSLEAIYKDSAFDVMQLIKDSQRKDCEIFVISNWYPFNAIIYNDVLPNSQVYSFLYPKVEELLKKEEGLTDESLAISLKSLGDETRYQVLLESIKDDVKSKDIANKLNITSANVTFHTQKLINANILLFASNGSKSKYRVNRDLLREVIARLKNDLDL